MNVTECTTGYREQKWAGIMQECRNSGLSNRAWCQEHGISIKTFYYWQNKLRRTAAEQIRVKSAVSLAIQEQQTIVPVILPERESTSLNIPAVIIQKGDLRIEINKGTSDTTVSAVLRSVKHLC